MSVRRVMGTEVEYGISVPGQPAANPMVTSSQVVNAYGARPELTRGGRARWDYEEESPLRDARGFTYSGALYDPAEALADEDLGLANVILTNGARLYVDHAHPEYSTPEVTNPRDLVLWDKAGERVMAEAARRAATVPTVGTIHLYKNNTDNKGASYGAHENYLMRRQTPVLRHRGAPDAVLRDPPDRLRGGPGRTGPGWLAARLPDLAAGGLLRGRGRPGDDAEAADHQHPRRAALRRRQVPPAARHHRRCQPVRDLHLSQGRHDLARTVDDREQGPHRRPRHRRPGRRAQGGQPRSRPDPSDPAPRRAPAHRPRPAVGLSGTGTLLCGQPRHRRR